MTRDDIIRMAREAGMVWASGLNGSGYHINHSADLERFAALVAAAEREECAAICKQQMTGTDVAADFARYDCMTAILNRQ